MRGPVIPGAYTLERFVGEIHECVYRLSFYRFEAKSHLPKPAWEPSHFLPVAASLTVSLPATMFFTVAWMSEKSLNVWKGTFSFSQ